MTSQNESVLELDALIVGAGFSGIYTLHRLRDELKLNVKIIDAGSDLGGTWHWNTYPGARVDCPAPVYGFGIEEIWKTWNWSERYPGYAELQAYFQHVDLVLSIKKDCIFNSRVNAASFDPANAKWTIRTQDGKTVLAKYFIPAVGFAAQQYVPPWKGLDSYEGTIHHSSMWPKEGVDVRGKRVAIIGTGATGVQIVQEWAKEAAETFVFQRTPNISLPMDQTTLNATDQDKMRAETGGVFARCQMTAGGLAYEEATKTFAQFSPEEYVGNLNRLYDQGGFRYWVGGSQDLLLNPEG
jgi:cation diffusion facilitator CzcD-associated flavoprotein CzcO